MSLSEELLKEIEASRDKGAKRTVIAHSSGSQVEVEVADADRIGVSIDAIRVSRPNSDKDKRAVGEQAERLTVAVDYLGERLRIVESDSELGGSIVRSESIGGRKSDPEFYEFHLTDGNQIDMRRHKADRKTVGRSPAKMPMTAETLGRIVDDLDETLS